ncbi:hypothetical protein PGT21_026772 [Puccinia graminis f. sp. tritici]|uniref:Uncharacterized protein n=1 Tax=Puccinia graminis f. sp. tritici TaxID=56615 RepID=A0A5B0S3A9_PUCGR|nr:hypothetical protein PGT21_000402 [Puccinia graminis f. sp. tritici]KAA1083162.1 hypothetical protein PGT21_026772 [Puccinia graminis f. sp. tritici]KAA1132221.1 hypothetical protein PGTUg99_003325 [Puccinia graminis f. sp. tritici]KAA1132232.1 hypothetical protein PGTUg99_002558 [Puccinia graminis f. sp. tritici]
MDDEEAYSTSVPDFKHPTLLGYSSHASISPLSLVGFVSRHSPEGNKKGKKKPSKTRKPPIDKTSSPLNPALDSYQLRPSTSNPATTNTTTTTNITHTSTDNINTHLV